MTDWRDVAAAMNRLPAGELVAAMDCAGDRRSMCVLRRECGSWCYCRRATGAAGRAAPMYVHVVGDVHPYLRFPTQRKG